MNRGRFACFIVVPMKSRTLLLSTVAALAFFAPATVGAQVSPISRTRKFGLGAALGYPGIGVSINPFFSQRTSLQVDVGAGVRTTDQFFAGRVDFLYWFPHIASASWGDLRWYVGAGAYVDVPWGRYYSRRYGFVRSGAFAVGGEVVVGIGFQLKFPIDIMVEAVPRLQLFDEDGVWADPSFAAALHVRYYF